MTDLLKERNQNSNREESLTTIVQAEIPVKKNMALMMQGQDSGEKQNLATETTTKDRKIRKGVKELLTNHFRKLNLNSSPLKDLTIIDQIGIRIEKNTNQMILNLDSKEILISAKMQTNQSIQKKGLKKEVLIETP